MDVLSIFRLIAPEFKDVTDETVKQWIALTVPLVSRQRFRTVYDQALALLSAHRMEMSNKSLGAAADAALLGGLNNVASYKEGQVSVSFDTAASDFSGEEDDLTLTKYGVQYLTLQRKKVMPIVSAGARIWR